MYEAWAKLAPTIARRAARMGRLAVLGVLATIVIAPTGCRISGHSQEPRSTIADATARAEALARLGNSACAPGLTRELAAGHQLTETCNPERSFVLRELARRVGELGSFGVVEWSRIELASIRLVLSVASGCRNWPLARQPATALSPADAMTAGCRVRRYRGPVTISLAPGTAASVWRVASDHEGRVALDLSEFSAPALARDGSTRLVIGHQGWAGTLEFAVIERAWADWHARSIEQGRGVAGLFAVAHPDHPWIATARALASEAWLARQEQDYRAVARGELSADRFLQRHPLSPFRRSVQAMLEPPAQRPRD